MAFQAIGKVSDFPPGRGVEVRLGARQIAVYHVGGRFHALKNICPHQGVQLHRAPPRDGRAICLGHGWEFDLASGACLRGGKAGERVAVYPIRVEGDTVLIDVG